MQPIKYLSNWLLENTSHDHYIFSIHDLRALFPHLSDNAFKTLLSRAVASNLLIRPCRGIYIYKRSMPSDGNLLYMIASVLRAEDFNYISLETVLSEAGIISQIPINYISIISSGRSNMINCKDFGTIEFVHTKQKPAKIMDQLIYDKRYNFWRATPALALKDMKRTHRKNDLINWDIASEFI